MADRGRRVLIAVTALPDGIVVVQPPVGAPSVLSGEHARVLHELASDTQQPEMRTEQIGSSRLLSLGERLLKHALGDDEQEPEG